MFEVVQLDDHVDDIAPDRSEIRLLVGGQRGGLAYGCLPSGEISRAIRHRLVEELWYITEGKGQLWRKLGDHETTVELQPGVSVTIPPESDFQFRSSGDTPLCFIMTTMPPWPGASEAIRVPDHWKLQSESQEKILPELDATLYRTRKYLPSEDNPNEIVYETDAVVAGHAWGVAYADILISMRHKHRYIRETYVHLDGPSLEVQIGSDWILLERGDSVNIPLDTPHMARSAGKGMARILVTTCPAWYADDHILID